MSLIQYVESIFNSRYSCRGFKSDSVPREQIERILRLSQTTASWTNVQPWQVHIASGDATSRIRDALMQASQKQSERYDYPPPKEYAGIYKIRRRECGYGLYGALGISKDDRDATAQARLRNFEFFSAPHVAFITAPEALGIYGVLDCGGYVANFMTAATSLGISTIAQAAVASQSGTLREQLKVSDDNKIVCGISFGYADENHPANKFRTSRAQVSEAVTWLD